MEITLYSTMFRNRVEWEDLLMDDFGLTESEAGEVESVTFEIESETIETA